MERPATFAGVSAVVAAAAALLVVVSLALATPDQAQAHPGNTDAYGGHTCRTNCPSWGLSYGEYHFHDDPPGGGGGGGGAGLGGLCFSPRCRINKTEKQIERLSKRLQPKQEKLASAASKASLQEAEALSLQVRYEAADAERDAANAGAQEAWSPAYRARDAYIARLEAASERVEKRDDIYGQAHDEWAADRTQAIVAAAALGVTGLLLAFLSIRGVGFLGHKRWAVPAGAVLLVAGATVAVTGLDNAAPEPKPLPDGVVARAARFADEPEDNLPPKVEQLMSRAEAKQEAANDASAEADELEQLLSRVESNHQDNLDRVSELTPQVDEMQAELADLEAKLAGF